jgi:hypothetical protein
MRREFAFGFTVGRVRSPISEEARDVLVESTVTPRSILSKSLEDLIQDVYTKLLQNDGQSIKRFPAQTDDSAFAFWHLPQEAWSPTMSGRA